MAIYPDASKVDWDDVDAVRRWSGPVLDGLAGADGLNAALDRAQADEHLHGLCESSEMLDKIVVFDDPAAGFRIRVHVLKAGGFDRPHNHRWTFASVILFGAYQHSLFGDESIIPELESGRRTGPVMRRVETSGSRYVLHHTAIHNVSAEQDAVSVILRGPARKPSYWMLDRQVGEVTSNYGAADGQPANYGNHVMSAAERDRAVAGVRARFADAARSLSGTAG